MRSGSIGGSQTSEIGGGCTCGSVVRCAKREDRFSPRETPWLQSWVGFPRHSESVDELILDGRIAVVGFLGGGFDHFFGWFYRDGEVVHHILFSCRKGLETSDLQGAGCTL